MGDYVENWCTCYAHFLTKGYAAFFLFAIPRTSNSPKHFSLEILHFFSRLRFIIRACNDARVIGNVAIRTMWCMLLENVFFMPTQEGSEDVY